MARKLLLTISVLCLSGCILSFERDFDFDRDGVKGTTDCNDALADVHPDAEEQCGDGIDQDCAGGDATCVPGSPLPTPETDTPGMAQTSTPEPGVPSETATSSPHPQPRSPTPTVAPTATALPESPTPTVGGAEVPTSVTPTQEPTKSNNGNGNGNQDESPTPTSTPKSKP